MAKRQKSPQEAKVIAIANQKGGTAKTTTTINLGIGLADRGKRVLFVDVDSQEDLTTSLEWADGDNLPVTLTTQMEKIIRDEPIGAAEGILHHDEGKDLIPSNLELSGMEMMLVNTMSREFSSMNYLNGLKQDYDYILIGLYAEFGDADNQCSCSGRQCDHSVQAHYLSLKGMTKLMKTIGHIQRKINPGLKVDGVLLTLAVMRTDIARATAENLKRNYGRTIKVYQIVILVAVKAVETSVVGKGIYRYVNMAWWRRRMRHLRGRWCEMRKKSGINMTLPTDSRWPVQ